MLQLHLLDVYRAPLDEQVIVMFRNQMTGSVRTARSVSGKALRVSGLDPAPMGLYRVEADPPSYLPAGIFVNVDAAETTTAAIRFAVDPSRVARVRFPPHRELDRELRRLLAGSSQVEGFDGLSGKALYDRFDDLGRAGLLNLAAKCSATVFADGHSVASQLVELRALRADRWLTKVSNDLRDAVAGAVDQGLFDAVSGAFHPPPPGFSSAGSFKTRDRFGNLHVTLFTSSGAWLGEMDIDDANGLAHAFQVLRNAISGRSTHPYAIHEILMLYQHLDAGYRFET